jgi:hypothetical protein
MSIRRGVTDMPGDTDPQENKGSQAKQVADFLKVATPFERSVMHGAILGVTRKALANLRAEPSEAFVDSNGDLVQTYAKWVWSYMNNQDRNDSQALQQVPGVPNIAVFLDKQIQDVPGLNDRDCMSYYLIRWYAKERKALGRKRKAITELDNLRNNLHKVILWVDNLACPKEQADEVTRELSDLEI